MSISSVRLPITCARNIQNCADRSASVNDKFELELELELELKTIPMTSRLC
jgi:hypothetical protein